MSKPRNVYDGKIAGLYDLGDTLGRGHFAVVKLARHVFTGEKVAVKVIDKMKLDEVSRAHLFQEVRCMKLVQHPNVVRLYEVIDTQTKLYLILELGDGGDMYDYIMKHEKGLDEEAARKYFRQIVHAISYCHRLHVVHRDLKPENVVFFEKLGMVKLTDFGFSNRFCPGQKLETSCGSLAYSAPEILLGDSYDAPAVDIWSLGVILYMLVCGHPPFQEANDSETLTMIMDCKYTIPSHVSSDCSRLIQKMLIRDPEIRATLDEITNHPWLGCSSTVQHADYLPLVSREHLSEEDHKHILQKMANGNIATQEDIASALDKNAYNHITATYFLLAERKLRAIRQEQAKLLNASHVSDLSALAISPRNPAKPCLTTEENLPRTVESLLSPQESRRTLRSPVASCTLDSLQNCHCRGRSNSRTSCGSPPLSILNDCSVVNQIISPTSALNRVALLASNGSKGKSDSLDMRKKKHASFAADSDLSVNMIEIDRVGLSCLQNEELTSDSSTESKGPIGSSVSLRPNLHSFAANKFRPVTTPNNRKLHSVRSSPQLTLNEIYEEIESEGEVSTHAKFNPCHNVNNTGLPTTRVLQSHQSIASPAVLRKYEQRRRYAKARTASCSSSDASDEDTDTRKRKAEKLKRMPGWSDRRREDDDDDPNHGSGPQGGNGTTGKGSEGGGSVGEGGARQGPPNDPPPSTPHDRQRSSPERPRPADSSISHSSNYEEGNDSENSAYEELKGTLDAKCAVNSNRLYSSPPSSYTSESSVNVSHSSTSVTRSVLGTTSPPQSPLCTPNITSLRQSKTLNQLNRYVSPASSLLGSPVLDLANKENRVVTRHNSPLHFFNLKRTSRYRPPSYPSSSVNAMSIGNTVATNLSPRINYKHGLYRLLKHAPQLGSKRWDINRNGLNAPEAVVVSSSPANNYDVGLRVTSTSSSPSHSKCCSLC